MASEITKGLQSPEGATNSASPIIRGKQALEASIPHVKDAVKALAIPGKDNTDLLHSYKYFVALIRKGQQAIINQTIQTHSTWLNIAESIRLCNDDGKLIWNELYTAFRGTDDELADIFPDKYMCEDEVW